MMERFLRGCRGAVQNKQDGLGVHVVLGNEACDLDSLVSTITLAYFLAKTSSEKRTTFIPVLNIPRSEFPLRTESTFFLQENRIREELLIFRDEIDLHGIQRAGLLSLTLVDHNVLPSSDAMLEGAVVEVIDHRPLERKRTPFCNMTAEPVGSCCTLITERIVRSAPEFLDRQVAGLLYGTIILDCVNMAPEAGKVTPKDSDYVTMLESKFPDLPSRKSVFDSLQNAKFNVSGLATEQMLRKDLKAVSGRGINLAISAVYMRLESFFQRHSLQQDLREFCLKYGYNVLVAMTISFNEKNEPFRQIAVYSGDTTLRESVSKALQEARNPHLMLSVMQSPHSDIRAFYQENTLASRKKVLPIIKDFLKDIETMVVEGAVDCGTAAHCLKAAPGCGLGVEEGGDTSEDLEDVGEMLDQFDMCGGQLDDDFRCKRYANSRLRHHAEDADAEEDSALPPTPMNSLVEGCPLDNGLPKLSEAILEKFSKFAAEDLSENTAETGKK
ncbi:exopolyphosphatase PRUNE1 [Latimeria chalumnae]|uniref:Prune exopolyphosphatase 1 n=1 Tax=Latimeria chalumnae TaxID=7897 RepID=H3AM51_LATCH|nr:PREDICTED: protein prune homolog [Latimeria chalumnae]|eukprot:XP_006006142.1 PREDICTED: protein prune homolog [Latimeria chalumnae]